MTGKKPSSCALCAELLRRICELPKVKDKSECAKLMDKLLSGDLSTDDLARILSQKWKVLPTDLDKAYANAQADLRKRLE